MSRAPRSTKSAAPAPRHYDRRKRRGPIRKTGRPIWRQPLMLGLAVLLLGLGGGGGWLPGSRVGWSRRRTGSMRRRAESSP
jgi:cell division protein FtsQ